jgi:beta-glucosidase
MNLRRTLLPLTAGILAACLAMTGCSRWSETDAGAFRIVHNTGGRTLAYAPASGVTLVTENRFAFKDLNRSGALDPYEDWRLPARERARDLASRMTVEQIAGLMLYSGHQAVPEPGLTDDQVRFLREDNVRHVLVTSIAGPETAAGWINNLQALCESVPPGIPANVSSDPRHLPVADAEYNAGAGGQISMWPSSLGMAASFDPGLVRQFGSIAAREYRALGIATALSPQVDLATDPRWSRVSGTFGEHPRLAADLARAYVDGFQTSTGGEEIEEGWGYASVNTMVKHWPGGGTGEGGRDAHYAFGKYAVYPGGNFARHLVPFLEGAFRLEGPTRRASAVMPYYTISHGIDPGGENVGNSYSRYIIDRLLRTEAGYDGVVCTDWGVTRDASAVDGFGTTPWGAEALTVARRHYKILMAGVDQFGGNNDAGPVLEAWRMGVAEHGEEWMRARMEQSAVRLLTNIFRVGLFENPYLDPGETGRTVGSPDFVRAGYAAQLRSVVMLKNRAAALPAARGKTVYLPMKFTPARRDFFGREAPATLDYAVSRAIAEKYFRVSDDPTAADFALVVVDSPEGGTGYSAEDARRGRNGYRPITLQYRPYRATAARARSLAGGDPLETSADRSYRGRIARAANERDLETILAARRAMGPKPVVVAVRVSNPMVFAEFEREADAILLCLGIQDQALMEIVSGAAQPSGLLPIGMPADMVEVERQNEDVPFDMKCHVDTEGNAYDFGFGLSWHGVIRDGRTARYPKP